MKALVHQHTDLIYDGSFEGFLTAIFEVFDRKLYDVHIQIEERHKPTFFSEALVVKSDSQKAARVFKGLKIKSSKEIIQFIYKCFLSEQSDAEDCLLHLIRAILRGEDFIFSDYSDEKILRLHQLKKMMNREIHKMHAFVRFQETKDGQFIALVNPDFNVLPLIGKHFQDRYPAMHWLIYDTIRHYGIEFKGDKIEFASFLRPIKLKNDKLANNSLSEVELEYQNLWRTYFEHVNIKERENKKLHLQHLPKRYWRFLIEKHH